MVATSDLESLSTFVIDRLGDQTLITRARTHLVTDVLVEGSDWRLNTLSETEAQRVPRAKPPRPRAARQVPPDLRALIFHELYRDGRSPTGNIAAKVGVSNQRVTDAINTTAFGRTRFRAPMSPAAIPDGRSARGTSCRCLPRRSTSSGRRFRNWRKSGWPSPPQAVTTSS
nr:hypothetical protein [Rhodococcus wratislaviensis]